MTDAALQKYWSGRGTVANSYTVLSKAISSTARSRGVRPDLTGRSFWRISIRCLRKKGKIMKTKIIAIALLVQCSRLASVMLSGCSAPTPETDLTAAVAVLDIVSVLPNLTPADKAWIAAAANGLSCSSTEAGQGQSQPRKRRRGIAICFASLPVVPPAGSALYCRA